MPLDALQTIISDPQYASVDAPTRHKIAQKALADPDVKALSQEDQFALTKSILFPTEEKAPELAGNLSLSEIPGAMGEQIGSGIQNLKQAITGEGAILPNMVKGAAKIIGGIGTPIAAASQEAGKLVQRGVNALGGGKDIPGTSFSPSDVAGAVTSAAVPFVIPGGMPKTPGFIAKRLPEALNAEIAIPGAETVSSAVKSIPGVQKITSLFGKRGPGVSDEELNAARQAVQDATGAVEEAKSAGIQAKPLEAQALQEAEAASGLPQARQGVVEAQKTAARANVAKQLGLKEAATSSGLEQAQANAAEAAKQATMADLLQRQGAQGMEAGLKDVGAELPSVSGIKRNEPVTSPTEISPEISASQLNPEAQAMLARRNGNGKLQTESAPKTMLNMVKEAPAAPSVGQMFENGPKTSETGALESASGTVTGARSEIGQNIQSDIQNKIAGLVKQARSLYGPIREEAANIPTGKTKATIGEALSMGESGPVNPRTMRQTAETWRDLSAETMNEIQDRMNQDPTLNFGTAAQQVLESKSKQTVADLIDQKQRAAAIMRGAQRRGQDNAARMARNELNDVQAQIVASAPEKMVKDLAKADKFYAQEYAPIASHGAFPREVRDMAPEDVANAIVRTGNRQEAIQAIDSISAAVTPDTKNRLAGYTFQKLLEQSSPKGAFDPNRALTVFQRLDPELRSKLFGDLAPQINDALETFKSAAADRVKAQGMAKALNDAADLAKQRFEQMTAGVAGPAQEAQNALRQAIAAQREAQANFNSLKSQATMPRMLAKQKLDAANAVLDTANRNYEQLLAKGSMVQRFAAAKAGRMVGRGGAFLQIIGIEEVGRGVINEWQGNRGIGAAQIARGATLAFPMQVAHVLTSPGAKGFAKLLSAAASPKTQTYASTIKKLSDYILQDAIQTADEGQGRANAAQ